MFDSINLFSRGACALLSRAAYIWSQSTQNKAGKFAGWILYTLCGLEQKVNTLEVQHDTYVIQFNFSTKCSWDEWVPESRVLKYNDDNVKRQKELSRLYDERSKKDNKKGMNR